LDILELFSILDRLREEGKLLHWFLNSVNDTLSPVKSTRNGRQVAGDRGTLILSVNKSFTFHEDCCNCLQILLIEFEELNVLLLKFILDDGSVEKSFEGIKKLEFSNDGVAIIETLGEDGSESSLKFLNALSELVEVIIESSLFDVHDVVFNLHEVLNGSSELFVDLNDSSRKGLTLGVTNLNLFELLELHDGVGQVHNVLASLLE
jgi:hypothetical protein